MPKCRINGIEVEVPQGATIIEAYKKIETEIAHYCWHPGLSIAGVCRLCMVEVEGMPKLQIACNTEVRDGMVINNQSEKVKETVRWGMDFHLINHPLDCPICDQAGECGLQEQYMKFGKYDPEMSERKVKKRKVVDLGSKIVLDTERCILCSRCVRFTSEISKTNEFGIFNRGDHSEIGTVDDQPVENNYALNTVDICPVGALTSKDFRFRQRVWYLKEADTICTGCSTGCSVKVYYNEEGMWRVKPLYNPDVNGHWMCDEGRDIYKYLNRQNRQTAFEEFQEGVLTKVTPGQVYDDIIGQLAHLSADEIAAVVTGQYSNEEYDAFFEFLKTKGVKRVYHWLNNKKSVEDFDGLLLRGDRNPNTKGLLTGLAKNGFDRPWTEFESSQFSAELLFVLGPENPKVFADIAEVARLAGRAKRVVWFGSAKLAWDSMSIGRVTIIPAKAYTEKEGTYINYKGLSQAAKPVYATVQGAVCLKEFTSAVSKVQTQTMSQIENEITIKTNFFAAQAGGRV